MTVVTKSKGEGEEDKEVVPAPPDGGWGWVIVFASFMVHVIADGIAYSFGVYVEKFVEYFECTRSEIGLLGSIMLGVTWGSGPIASALVNKFGCKLVTILGTFVAAFGFILSVVIAEYVRDNVYVMYITFGVISGLGLGLAYLPAIVSVSYYFEKRRSLATGLAVCGSGIGTFIFAPLTEALIEEYSWKGTVLIETGLLFHCILCGAVMRPLRVKPSQKYSLEPKKSDQIELLDMSGHRDSADGEVGGKKRHRTISLTQAPPPAGLLHKNNLSASDTCVHHTGRHVDPIGPIDRKDVFYNKSVEHLPEYKQDPVGFKQSMLSLPPPEEKEVEECGWLQRLGVSKKVRHTLSQMMDCSIIADLVFLLFAVSNLLTSIGFTVPYIYLPDRGTSLEFSTQESAFLVSLVGISNTVGRVLFGWIADFPCVNRLMLYNTVLVLCGLTSIVSSLCVTYYLMATYAACFGLFIGVYTCMTPIVLVDLIGLDKLSNGFGLVLLFQGIGGVIGPPIAGALYDHYQNYDYSFYMMGTCVLVSGAMLYPIMCIRPQKRVVKDKKVKEVNVDDHHIDTIKEEPVEV